MNESTNNKRDNLIVVLLAIVLVLLLVCVYSLTQLVSLRSAVRSLDSQYDVMEYSITNLTSSSLERDDMENLLQSYLDNYFDQENAVAASYTLDVSQIKQDEGQAQVTVTCIPRYEVTDKKDIACYAASGSDQTLIYQADSLDWDGTVLKATLTLPINDTYSYFVTLPNETGAKVTQCLADCKADYDDNWDVACDLECVSTVAFYVYMSESSGNGTVDFTLNVESYEDDDDFPVTITTLVDGEEYETHDVRVYENAGQLSLTYSSSDFKAGQKITFRADATTSDGRTGTEYADSGFVWDESGNLTMLNVDSEDGEAAIND